MADYAALMTTSGRMPCALQQSRVTTPISQTTLGTFNPNFFGMNDMWMKCRSCVKDKKSLALLILRLGTGLVFLLEGWGKLFGGNPGMPAFIGMVSSLGFPLPAFFAYVVALVEFFGGLALLLGVGTCFFSVFLAIDMLVAFFIVKKLNLPAANVDLSLLCTVIALGLMGPGRYALMRGGCGCGGSCGCHKSEGCGCAMGSAGCSSGMCGAGGAMQKGCGNGCGCKPMSTDTISQN